MLVLQILESGDLWDSVSARLAAAEGSLPKAPANPASRTTRTSLPAVLSALQPLVECYFALCSVCGLLGAPPQPPSFDTVTPLDVEGQTAVHAALPQPESPRATQDAAPTFSQCAAASFRILWFWRTTLQPRSHCSICTTCHACSCPPSHRVRLE